MRARGTTNANARGNSRDRRRRREWLLSTFGDGRTCACVGCGAELDATTITVDRVVPGAEGGRYVRGNIRPMCAGCNSETGGRLGAERRSAAA